MHTKHWIAQTLGAGLLALSALSAQANTGNFYDPTNAASQSGKTSGFELFGTIGCPGRGLMDAPCPKPAAPKPVDKDSDGDGVVDSKDKCPNTPAGRKVNSDGCELDSDGDGVVDGLDRCPTTPAGRKVNSQGCEIDSDGDGVFDDQDKCPGTPAGQKVGPNGCEVDSDGDGIVDSQDKCPTVYAKTADGCPVAAPAKLVLEGVNFDNDQATLKADAMTILDQAAESLKQWGNIKVEVAGHTDSLSSDAYNLSLSQRRADVVRSYLIGKGIDGDRLTAKGYGESSPVAENESEAGRYKNRRVELVPLK